MAQNDIKWTAPDATHVANSYASGPIAGPFQNWQTGGTYESLYDQAIGEIFTDVMPQVVFGGFYEHIATGNVVSFPRGEVYQEDEFDDTYNIAQPLTLQARSGTIRTCELNHVIKIGIIFQNFELRTSGSGRLAFEYREAINGQARKFETVTVKDLIAGGLSSQDQLVYKKDASGQPTDEVDIYNTFLNVRKQMIERGFAMNDLDVYATPDIVNLIMNDSHFISTFGNAQIAGEEVRFGFRGIYLGFSIYESGRLSGMTLTTPANLIFVARSQVILCRFPVQPIMIQPAPANYIDSSILSGLEYFKHFIVNDYGIRYINTLAE